MGEAPWKEPSSWTWVSKTRSSFPDVSLPCNISSHQWRDADGMTPCSLVFAVGRPQPFCSVDSCCCCPPPGNTRVVGSTCEIQTETGGRWQEWSWPRCEWHVGKNVLKAVILFQDDFSDELVKFLSLWWTRAKGLYSHMFLQITFRWHLTVLLGVGKSFFICVLDCPHQ